MKEILLPPVVIGHWDIRYVPSLARRLARVFIRAFFGLVLPLRLAGRESSCEHFLQRTRWLLILAPHLGQRRSLTSRTNFDRGRMPTMFLPLSYL